MGQISTRVTVDELKWSILAAIASATVWAPACGAQSTTGTGQDTPELQGSNDAPETPSAEPTDPAGPGSPPPSDSPPDVSSPEPTPSTNPPPAGSSSEPEPAPVCEFGQLNQECYDRTRMEGMVRFGTGQIPIEPTPSDAEVAAAFLDNGCLPKSKVADGCCNPATTEAELVDGLCCYTHCTGACCGRPFTVEGAARVAAVERSSEWCGDANLGSAELGLHAQSLPQTTRQEIAREWLRDAQMEHASIAAFSAFTLSLLALGAPPELVHLSQQACADEIRHAQSCFAVASAYAGEAVGPGPLLSTGLDLSANLERLVISTFVEGCIGETVASMVASAQASATSNGALRQMLLGVSRDEKNHAVLAWKFVAWGVRQRPQLAAGLNAALKAARAHWQDDTPAASHEVSWHRAGRLTRAERVELAEVAFAQVIQPALSELLGPLGRGRSAARAA